jgi:hypothetical protein
MLRKFNYTGRMKIPRRAVAVTLLQDRNGAPAFDIRFDLSSLKLPGHAKVYVEAYHRASYMRFDYGRVSDIRVPQESERRLTAIEGGGTAQFRVKVVDETAEHGCVLAEADGVTPLEAGDARAKRTPLLPVVVMDLGPQVWRIEFETADGRPVLELNKQVSGVAQIAANDDEFCALVYPAVIRQILYRVLRIERFTDTDGPKDDWRVQWLRFACNLPGVLAPYRPENDDDERAEAKHVEWIEEVAERFCSQNRTLDRFVRAHDAGVNN